jgi:hypothetical protein
MKSAAYSSPCRRKRHIGLDLTKDLVKITLQWYDAMLSFISKGAFHNGNYTIRRACQRY